MSTIDLSFFTNSEFLENLFKALVFVIISYPIVLFIRSWINKTVTQKHSLHYGQLSAKVFHYIMIMIIFFVFLNELGFSITPLLGAAGILGIAIGFASQTSVSNIISGFFLIAEKPFIVGDVVNINNTTGVVLSIDTLSVKLRTFDNRFIRIPNEMIIKSQLTNNTRFDIRRQEIKVSVAYKEDLARVKEILTDIAKVNPLALEEPAPIILFDQFNNSSVDLLFMVWSSRPDFLTLKNELNESIKQRFDEEGVEIPFPHTSLYAGEASKPFKVQMVKESDG